MEVNMDYYLILSSALQAMLGYHGVYKIILAM